MLEAEDGNSGASSLTDVIGIGTLTRLVPRELADEVVLSLGRKEKRSSKLPARVVAYFVMALALFYDDGYEEVMRKLAGGLEYLGTWRREWEVPTPGALCQARQRLGPEVMRELYERVSVPCAMRSTKGAWLAGRRLMAIDGFGLEAPDSEGNAGYFGYAERKGGALFPLSGWPRWPSAARTRSSPRKSGKTEKARKRWPVVFSPAGRSGPGCSSWPTQGCTATRISGWSPIPEPALFSG